MRIGNNRLPAEFNAGAYNRLITRLGEIFGLIDRSLYKVDTGRNGVTHTTTTSYTVQLQDGIVLVDGTATTLTVTLPEAAAGVNKRVVVVNKNGGPVNLSSAELVGSASVSGTFGAADLVSTGVNWVRL